MEATRWSRAPHIALDGSTRWEWKRTLITKGGRDPWASIFYTVVERRRLGAVLDFDGRATSPDVAIVPRGDAARRYEAVAGALGRAQIQFDLAQIQLDYAQPSL